MDGKTNAQQSPGRSPEQLKYYENRLLEERKRAVAQMEEFDDQMGQSEEAADGELSTWRFHIADEGTDTYEREQSFLMASREGRLLWHIDEALRRLYRNPERFGRCDDCGKQMSDERLDALPYAVTCINCKQDWERGDD